MGEGKTKGHRNVYLHDVLQLVADENVFLVVVDLWVVSDEGVLRADVDGVVNLPVDVSHLPGWMEQTLKRWKTCLFLFKNTHNPTVHQAGTDEQ